MKLHIFLWKYSFKNSSTIAFHPSGLVLLKLLISKKKNEILSQQNFAENRLFFIMIANRSKKDFTSNPVSDSFFVASFYFHYSSLETYTKS